MVKYLILFFLLSCKLLSPQRGGPISKQASFERAPIDMDWYFKECEKVFSLDRKDFPKFTCSQTPIVPRIYYQSNKYIEDIEDFDEPEELRNCLNPDSANN